MSHRFATQGFAKRVPLSYLNGLVKGNGAGVFSAATLGTDYIDSSYVREKLTSSRTYYVDTAGSNSNDGLTALTPFETIQHAANVVMGTLELGVFGVTIQLANGTYTAGAILRNYLASTGTVTIRGDPTTPSNVVISISAAGATLGNCFYSDFGVLQWNVTGMKLQTSGSGTHCLRANRGASLGFSNIIFGACVGAHIHPVYGGYIIGTTDYEIDGSAARHVMVQANGIVTFVNGITITLTGTPNFSQAYIQAIQGGVAAVNGMTFSGSATGKRYHADTNGVIDTPTGSATFFPGNVAGTTATGGQYS